jgi:hypothetical protein
MRTIVDGYLAAEMHRAAARSRADGDGGERFAREAERALDPELVRAIEHQSGIAIAEHLTEVFTTWNGGAAALDATLVGHFGKLGIALVVESAPEEDEDDDDWDEDLGEPRRSSAGAGPGCSSAGSCCSASPLRCS